MPELSRQSSSQGECLPSIGRNAGLPSRFIVEVKARIKDQGSRIKDQGLRDNKRGFLVTKLRVNCFSMSIDGYGAGPDQDLANPLGVGGMALHDWAFATRTFQRMHGSDGGATGVDDDFAARGFANVGAWILGRNMFGPIRGAWPDEAWNGWWGDNPPYHTPVFVLTHHARPSITMAGGTVFHFVVGGINAALAQAVEAAGGQDIRLGGGVATIRQYLRAALIDEMHLAISPVLLGCGEHLFAGIDAPKLGYQCTEHVATVNATHVVLTRRK
jgi:dihydrofolate reductase